ncbi:MAG: hypothetical protein ACRDL5_18655 [Solirubrobacteraceae bacterium]
MSQPRGRRTRHVAVYLSEAEATAWDLLRVAQAGVFEPDSRAFWVMEHVTRDLEDICDRDGPAHRTEPARRALQMLDEELGRLGELERDRSHGRINRRRTTRKAPPQ